MVFKFIPVINLSFTASRFTNEDQVCKTFSSLLHNGYKDVPTDHMIDLLAAP